MCMVPDIDWLACGDVLLDQSRYKLGFPVAATQDKKTAASAFISLGSESSLHIQSQGSANMSA